jgi:phage terminase large subunit
VPATATRSRVRYPPYARGFFGPAARYRVLYGGRGAARSWTVARKLLVLAGQRTLRILCARELQRSIQDSVHRLLTDQIERLHLPGFEATRGEIRHTGTGSLFIFEGLRYNVTKIKSLEGIDVAWVEEAERVSEESWNVLIPTVRKPGSEIWITFNPDVEGDPTYRRFVMQPPPDAVVLKVSSDDNPWLPDVLRQEREYLYRVDPDAAAHVWGGECRQATDAQILKGKWVVEEFEPGKDWDGPYHGADFGFAQDPTTIVRCWTHARTLYVERESYAIGLELDDTAPRWKRDVPDAERYVIRADNARPESISYLKRHGLPRVEGVEKWKGSVEDGIAHLRQYEQIVIHPRCKHTADEARHYSYKVDQRTGDVLPEVVDAHNHMIDALRYALAPLIRQRSAPNLRVLGA